MGELWMNKNLRAGIWRTDDDRGGRRGRRYGVICVTPGLLCVMFYLCRCVTRLEVSPVAIVACVGAAELSTSSLSYKQLMETLESNSNPDAIRDDLGYPGPLAAFFQGSMHLL